MGGGVTPKWLKRRARSRMAETGEKYTQALRRIKEELEEKNDDGTDRDPADDH